MNIKFIPRLFLCSALFLFAAGGSIHATEDIVAIGDSITQADSTHYGYRYELWKKLIDAGKAFDNIGSLSDNYNGNPVWPQHNNLDFDQDHEGHWGWRADQILTDLPTWLGSYTPNIALIHIGTNDMNQSQSVASTITEIEGIIDALRVDNPNVTIFLCQLIGSSNEPLNTNINSLNAAIPSIIQSKHTSQSPVILVDQNSGFDPALDTYDGIHPNSSGELKIATNFETALLANWPSSVNIPVLNDPGTTEEPGDISITWSDESGSGAVSYDLDISLDPFFSSSISGYPINSATPSHLANLPDEDIYYFRVRSVDSSSNTTGWSNVEDIEIAISGGGGYSDIIYYHPFDLLGDAEIAGGSASVNFDTGLLLETTNQIVGTGCVDSNNAGWKDFDFLTAQNIDFTSGRIGFYLRTKENGSGSIFESNGGDIRMYYWYGSPARWRVDFLGVTANFEAPSERLIPATWYFLEFKIVNNTLEVFLDGVMIGSITSGGSVDDTSISFMAQNGNAWDCYLDQLICSDDPDRDLYAERNTTNFNSGPQVPVLNDPGTTVNFGNLDITWSDESASGAISYDLDLSTDSGFGTNEPGYPVNTSNNSYTIDFQTADTFYLRVRSVDGTNNTSAWSNVVDIVIQPSGVTDYTQDAACIAAYLLDSNTDDSSANAFNGIEQNGVDSSGIGQYSGAYVFDGVDDYIEIPDDPGFTLSSGFTATAWVKREMDDIGGIVSQFWQEDAGSNPINDRAWALTVEDVGGGLITANCAISPDGAWNPDYKASATTAFSTGVWYHIAMKWETGQPVKVYVNGVLEGTSVGVPSGIYDATGPISIGNHAYMNGHPSQNITSHDGFIDEVGIFSRALSDAEILELMNNGLNGQGQPPIPEAPTNFVASQNGLTVDLNWLDDADNEDGFKIYRKLNTDPTFSLLTTIPNPDTEFYADAAVIENETYDYQITAYNLGGESSIAGPQTVTLLPGGGNYSDIIYYHKFDSLGDAEIAIGSAVVNFDSGILLDTVNPVVGSGCVDSNNDGWEDFDLSTVDNFDFMDGRFGFYLRTKENGSGTIFETNGGDIRMYYWFGSPARWKVDFLGVTANFEATSERLIPNTWYFLEFRIVGNELKVYLDGVLTKTITGSGTVNDSEISFMAQNGNAWDCYIDQMISSEDPDRDLYDVRNIEDFEGGAQSTPDIPTLSDPGGTVGFGNHDVSWTDESATGAISYDLDMSTDPNFGSSEVGYPINTSSTLYTINFQNEDTYYFRVRSVDINGGKSGWSNSVDLVIQQMPATDFTQDADCIMALLFNNNANDSSPNMRDGVDQNGVLTNGIGQFGGSYIFDGIDDFVEVSDDPAFAPTTGFSATAWVKRETDDLGGIVAQFWQEDAGQNSINDRAWALNVEDVGGGIISANCAISPDGAWNPDYKASGTSHFEPHTWYHIAMTWEPGLPVKVYVNGVLEGTSVGVPSNIFDASGPVVVGNTAYMNGHPSQSVTSHEGSIDEVGVFSRALMQSEIQELMENGLDGVSVLNVPDAPTNLTLNQQGASVDLSWTDNGSNEEGYKIYRKLNSDPNFSLLATLNGANTESYNDATVLESETYDYQITAFNGSGESTSAGPETITVLPGGGSFDDIIYHHSLDALGNADLAIGDDAVNFDAGILLETNNQQVGVGCADQANAGWKDFDLSTIDNFDFMDGRFGFYLRTKENASGTIFETNGGDIRMYYWYGSPARWKVDFLGVTANFEATAERLIPNTWYFLEFRIVGNELKVYLDGGLTKTIAGSGVVDDTEISFMAQNGNAWDCYLDQIIVSNDADRDIYLIRNEEDFSSVPSGYDYTQDADCIAAYQLNGDPLDAGPNSLNGVDQNGVDINGVGIVDGAYTFDGVDDFVEIADDAIFTPTNGFTATAWVKRDADDLGGVVSHFWQEDGLNNPINDRSWALTVEDVGGGLVTANCAISSDGTWNSDYATSAVTPIAPGIWYHIAMKWEQGQPVKVYVNGVHEGSSAGVPSGIFDAVGPVSIGNHAYMNGNSSQSMTSFEGSIDEVGLFSRALSDAEILEIMNSGLDGLYVPSSLPVPTNLSAMAIGPHADIDWNYNTPGIDGFKVYRRVYGETNFTQIGTTSDLVTHFTDMSMDYWTSYEYTVTAYQGASESNQPLPVGMTVTPLGFVNFNPVGDSITQGNTAYQTYRYELWKKLIDSGYSFEYTGSHDVGSGNGNTAPYPDYKGYVFDKDHEGWSGYRADEIEANIAAWQSGYNYDVVFLHIGTNDILQSQTVSSTVTEIENIIDEMRIHNPDAAIMLAKITPLADPVKNSDVISLNGFIDGIAASKSQVNSPIIVVDQYTGFDINVDSDDGIHPNALGELKMAGKWHAALSQLGSLLTAPILSDPGATGDPGDLTLTWTDESANGAVSYDVDVSLEPNFLTSLSGYPLNTSNLSHTINLVNVDTYYFRVRSVDINNNFSGWGNVESIEIQATSGGNYEDIIYYHSLDDFVVANIAEGSDVVNFDTGLLVETTIQAVGAGAIDQANDGWSDFDLLTADNFDFNSGRFGFYLRTKESASGSIFETNGGDIRMYYWYGSPARWKIDFLGVTSNFEAPSEKMETGVWYFFEFRIMGNELKVYRDGALLKTINGNGTVNDSEISFMAQNGNAWDCYLDQLISSNDPDRDINAIKNVTDFSGLPNVPILTDPGTTGDYGIYTIQWSDESSSGATSYELEISNTPDFSIVLETHTPTTPSEDVVLDMEQTYYFRVRSVDSVSSGGPYYSAFSNSEDIEIIYSGTIEFGLEFEVNDVTLNDQINPKIARSSSGNTLLVWQSFLQDGSDWGIFGQLYDSNGIAIGGEIQINSYSSGSQMNPVVTGLHETGGFAVAWEGQGPGDPDGIYVNVIDDMALTISDDLTVNQNFFSNVQSNPTVTAHHDGQFSVAWVTDFESVNNEDHVLYSQRFTNSGAPISGVDDDLGLDILDDHITPHSTLLKSGDTALVWERLAKGNDVGGIYLQIFPADPNQSPSGPPILINTNVLGSAEGISAPYLVPLNNGNMVVVWARESLNQTDGLDIAAQLVDPAGALLGSETLVNTFVSTDQKNPSGAMLNQSDFVILWESDDFTDGLPSILGQRFENDLTAVGSEFKLNAAPSTDVANSEISLLVNSDIMPVWQSDHDGDGSYGIFSRLGEMFNQLPNIPVDVESSLAGNDITVTWVDNSSNEDGFRVYVEEGYGNGFVLLAETLADEISYTHTSVTGGSHFTYYVTAFNAYGESSVSHGTSEDS